MTAIPSDIDVHDPDAIARERRRLPRSAAVFLGFLAAAGIASTAPFYANLVNGVDVDGWTTFAILASAAAVAHLFVVKSPRNQQYHTSYAFFIAAALLLPPELIVLVAMLANIPEWLKERYPWYIQTFNISNFTLNTLAAWGRSRSSPSTRRSRATWRSRSAGSRRARRSSR